MSSAPATPDMASPNRPRDLIGYGGDWPDPKWPNGARLALNFVLNYEEGSEASIGDGDGYTETGLTEATTIGVPHGERDLGIESMFEYGARVGFWRIVRGFRERGLPLTIFGCALALERHPPAVAAINDAGFDVCGHGWRWVRHYLLAEDEERDHIRQANEAFARLFGVQAQGWYCRGSPSLNTRRLLIEAGGFLYDSDTYNDELPYWVEVAGRPHLVVPYTLTNNDTKFAHGVMATGDDFFQFHRDAIDVLRADGKTQPRMMSIGLHQRLIGHPGRFAGLARLLDYVAGLDDIWVCRRLDIAKHWHRTHPA